LLSGVVFLVSDVLWKNHSILNGLSKIDGRVIESFRWICFLLRSNQFL
jgi:hypothetical protein